MPTLTIKKCKLLLLHIQIEGREKSVLLQLECRINLLEVGINHTVLQFFKSYYHEVQLSFGFSNYDVVIDIHYYSYTSDIVT